MFNQDYKDMLRILQKHDVEYILVGAYALAAHGYPRSTLDMDVKEATGRPKDIEDAERLKKKMNES